MFKRYLILPGAKTTAGGTVKTATSFSSCNDLIYALDGDLIDCPACGRQGVIKCVPPRLDVSYSGKQCALEHDLCICSCSPPPQLIANQNHNYQTIDDADGMDESLQAVSSQTPASAARDDPVPLQLIRGSNDEPFRLSSVRLWDEKDRMPFVIRAARQFDRLLKTGGRPAVERAIRDIHNGHGVR